MADSDRRREFPLLIRVNDQSGGLNTRTFATEIADVEAQELKNLFTDPGLIKKREGTTTFAFASSIASSVSGAVRSLVDFNPDQGSSSALLFHIADEIFSSDSSGVVSLRATIPNADNEGEFEQGLNKVFFCDGTSDPLVFDTSLGFSTIASSISGMVRHTTSEYFLNILWTNDVNNKSHLHPSDILTDIFDKSNTQKFGEGSGSSEIVRIQGYRNQELLVFMNNKIEELIIADPSDNSTWSRKVIDARYGLGAKDTVQELGGVVYFLDNENRVRALNRTALDAPTGTQAIPISDKIESEMDRINSLHISKASAGVHENFYMLSLPLDDATENSDVFIFDTRQGGWYGPWDITAAKFITSDIRAQGRDSYFGSTAAESIVRMFDGTFDDDGAAIETIWTTKKYNWNHNESEKIFNEVEIGVLGTGDGTVTVEARVDAADFSSVGSFNIVSGAPTLPVDLPFDLGSTGIVRGKFHLEEFSRGRNIDYRVKHNETTDVQYLELITTALDENYERENI